MKILITKDTMSDIYLDAVRIRQKVFVQEQGVPAKLEIDEKEAYSVHFVLYTDEKSRQLPCGCYHSMSRRLNCNAWRF